MARTRSNISDSGEILTHYRACNLCEAICGIEIKVEDGRISSIRGDKQDPFSRGHICAKAVALKDVHEDADRVRKPLRRRGSDFEEIGWDEAFDEAADRLRRLRDRHGAESLGVYLGNPNVHNWGAMLFGPLLIKALRPGNRFSATSVDQLPHHLSAYLMFGHQLLLPVPDLDRTDFMLVIGANPVVSNGSLMTAPDIRQRLKDLQTRGGRLIVVDPRRSETARIADQHIFIRPGADALLLAALVHTIFDEDLARPDRLAAFTEGLDQLPGVLRRFAPENVAGALGMDAQQIRALARDFATARSAVAYGRMGVSVQEFGGLCQWLVNVMNIVTGNFDRVGGAMFTKPAVDLMKFQGRGGYDRFRSSVRGLPEFGGELPSATMAEEILADRGGRIRGMLTVAGNPVLSTPNGRQLDRALASLDSMVSVDFYINETTRHAHVILPPTAALEHDHYDVVFNLLAIRNVARYSEALFEPGLDTRHDWEIALELSRRLQDGPLWQRLKATLARWQMMSMGPTGLLKQALKRGPYAQTVDFRALTAAEHGLDLGPLDPCLPQRLATKDQRIKLAPEPMVRDLTRLRSRMEPIQADISADPLLLISRRQPRSNNSWMHNCERLVKGKNRCTLLVHPADADRLGLVQSQDALIKSRVGETVAPVEVTDEIMPGVVCLPHGWGHDREGIQLEVASRHPGASINDLTDHDLVDPLSGNAALSAVPVTVSPLRGPRSSSDRGNTSESLGVNESPEHSLADTR
ncbi:MAG: molybdopterin-dependent oxidoreductase [Gammaproteobacteria bacterium]|nr:MAG: molybdopterin-dependent oxidoreductase [Gammaproteobacteria bacterium]